MGGREGTDAFIFGDLVSYGFWFFLLILMIGVMAGDKAPIANTLFALFGFIFYLSMGAAQIDIVGKNYPFHDNRLAAASMAIITSFVFAADAVFHGLNLRKD